MPEQRDRSTFIDDVEDERDRQDVKWGAHRDIFDVWWLTILVEEVGECAEALLKNDMDGLYREMTHAAAVLFAWAECIFEYGTARTGKDFRRG
jgi:NTP pyrophosphatase (non-canonical NTP hydrolase)